MVSLHAQQYHPFPEENAYWTVVEFDQQIWAWDTFIYTIKGDTNLNTKDYKKIFRLNDIPGSSDTLWELHCFMRQDSAYKKVWFIRHYMGETIEKLGYDFDAEIGDTVYLPAFDYENIGDSVFVLVDPVFDSTQLNNGEYRKNYFYNSLYPNIGFDPYAIEGIGTQRTPFPNLFYYDAFHQSTLYCVEVEGVHLYGDATPYSFCGFTVDISDNQITEQILIRKDVKNKEISITTNESSLIDIKMKLINMQGHAVISEQIGHLANEHSIDISHLNTGVYIIFLQTNSNLNITKKLFIQN
ncbi:MAG: hypothetical protein COZ08_09040 [Bacteroidetes bacterium CG_4_10_14_3_um_filter_42_6]|nr:MAG: hypothetical protein COZ08_09040 [Bacteroidetes bacterium CG_4_10_14_3_um_filter_42_6]